VRLLTWLLVATAAHPIAASADPIDSLLPGHSLEVPNSRLDALDPEDDLALNPDPPVKAPLPALQSFAARVEPAKSS
jgi:hypothetical protein